MNLVNPLVRTIAAAASLSLFASAGAADYHVVRTFGVPGGGGWDYLAVGADGQRLYIARSDRVQVVDPATGQLVGEVSDTLGVHGVALVPQLGKGYASSGRGNSISVFDTKTLATLATIATPDGQGPDSILFDDWSRNVVAFNGRSHNATVIDVSTDRVAKTIALAGRPESSVTDGRGRVFVDLEDRNAIAVIDMQRGEVADTLALPGCDEPAGLAIDRRANRLFVGCHNQKMLVVAIDDGRVIATLPIGRGVDADAFDAGRRLAFSSQGDGTVTVVHETTAGRFEVLQNVPTASGARTMALNPVTHEVYVVSAQRDEAPKREGQSRPTFVVRPGTFTVYVLGTGD